MSVLQIKHGPMPTNPKLEVGELGFDTSTNKLYIGNGETNIMVNPTLPSMPQLPLSKGDGGTGEVLEDEDKIWTSKNLIAGTDAPTDGAYPDGTIYIHIQGEST